MFAEAAVASLKSNQPVKIDYCSRRENVMRNA